MAVARDGRYVVCVGPFLCVVVNSGHLNLISHGLNTIPFFFELFCACYYSFPSEAARHLPFETVETREEKAN